MLLNGSVSFYMTNTYQVKGLQLVTYFKGLSLLKCTDTQHNGMTLQYMLGCDEQVAQLSTSEPLKQGAREAGHKKRGQLVQQQRLTCVQVVTVA